MPLIRVPLLNWKNYQLSPATTGFLKYNIENVKIAAAMSSIPMTKPTNPMILSKLFMNIIITRNNLPVIVLI